MYVFETFAKFYEGTSKVIKAISSFRATVVDILTKCGKLDGRLLQK